MDTQENILKAKKWPQYLAATIAILTTTSAGAALGWSAPALPFLEDGSIFASDTNFTNHSSKFLSTDESSLIGSLLAVGAIFGSIPAGFLCERFGRVTTLQISNIMLVAGWVTLCLENGNIIVLLGVRILQGCAFGISTVAVPLYNQEIVEVEIRGAIGVCCDASIALGVLLVYVLGTITSYFWMNISCTVLTVASIIGLLYIPESPIYLLQKLKEKQALSAFEWLRGVSKVHKYDVNKEFLVLRRIVDVSRQKSEGNKAYSFGFKKFKWKQLGSPTAKSLYIIMFLMILRQFSGINPVTCYTVHIFQETGSNISPYLLTTISGTIQLLFTFIAGFAVDKVGRRGLLLISSSGMAVSHLLLSIYFYLKQINLTTKTYLWIPVLSIGLFFAMFSTGLGPIPWFMMAEIIPTQSKVWVTGICSMTNWLCTFITVQAFLYMLRDIGNMGCYLFYSAVNIIGFVIIIFFVPETKNKSKETIENELSMGWKRK